jgi:hypothetical protein
MKTNKTLNYSNKNLINQIDDGLYNGQLITYSNATNKQFSRKRLCTYVLGGP